MILSFFLYFCCPSFLNSQKVTLNLYKFWQLYIVYEVYETKKSSRRLFYPEIEFKFHVSTILLVQGLRKKNIIIPLLAQEKFLPSRNPEERRSAKKDRKHVTSFISSVIKA